MWRRALAFLIDMILLLVVTAVENIVGIANNGFVGLVNLFLFLGYFAGMNYRFGGTVGKRVVGLRVALPASPNVFGPLIGRAFVKLICFFSPLAVVYGLIAIWRQDGRSLADFATGSTVVEVASLAPPAQVSVPGKLCASFLILFGPWIVLVGIFGGLFLLVQTTPFLETLIEQQ